MADVNLELEAVMRQVNSDLATFGRITASTADQLRDAQVGVRGFSNAVREAPKAMGKAAGDMASAMYRGAQSSKAFNSSIDAMADAADKAATVLSALIPGGPLARALIFGLGKLVGAVGSAAKVALEQSDATYQAFTQLSRAGAIGAQGTTGLATAAQRAGYNLLELGDVIEQINGIAPELASLGGTVARGAEVIHNMNAEAYKMGEMFQRLGMMPAEQRALVAQFAKQQIMTGRQLVGTFDASAQAIKNFTYETEALTRLTGQQRQQQQSSLERAMANEVFASTINRLRLNKEEQTAQQLEFVAKLTGGFSEQMQSAIADMAANRGLVSEDAAKLNQASMGEMQRFMQRIHAGEFKNQQEITAGFYEVLRGMNQFYGAVGNTAASMKVLGQNSMSNADFLKVQAMLNQNVARSMKLATGEVQDLAEGLDPLTAGQAKQVQIQRQLTTNLQALTQIAVPAAVDGLNATASAANAAAEALLGLVGKTPEQRARENLPSTPGAPGMGGQAPGGATGPFNRMPETPGVVLSPQQLATLEKVRNLIARVESEGGGTVGSGYTKLVGGKTQENLTDMTLAQVLQLQSQMGGGGAVGRYQIQQKTLEDLITALKLDKEKDKFDQAMQDKLANFLITSRGGFKQYADQDPAGTNAQAKMDLVRRLAPTWRGLPNRAGMKRGEETDQYGNKAGISMEEAVQSFARGGIARGPDTGYFANLHGNEAVVPLPDGRTIPVIMQNDFSDIRKNSAEMDQFVSALSREITTAVQNAANSIATNMQLQPILSALQDLTRYQRENVAVNEKMLRNSVG